MSNQQQQLKYFAKPTFFGKQSDQIGFDQMLFIAQSLLQYTFQMVTVFAAHLSAGFMGSGHARLTLLL